MKSIVPIIPIKTPGYYPGPVHEQIQCTRCHQLCTIGPKAKVYLGSNPEAEAWCPVCTFTAMREGVNLQTVNACDRSEFDPTEFSEALAKGWKPS
jgi:hypothetical protein